MSKENEKLNKTQLEEKKAQLTEEIETLKAVIEASNTPVFDLLIGEIKKAMEYNIAEEDWKTLKQNQKKVESYRDVEKIIQSQTDLLERKEEELEDVEYSLNNYQQNLFEDNETGAIDTGITNNAGIQYTVGDVYESNHKNPVTDDYDYYLIKKSSEHENEFSIIGNHIKEELALQYQKNKDLLSTTSVCYVGNIFIEDDNQESALARAKVIADAIEIADSESETN